MTPENNRTTTQNAARKDDPIFLALADVFGYSSFRPHQEEIVRAVLAGRDVFAVMPTGGGKSLCYQLPALLLPSVTVVVSPLLSLMKDQVDAARRNGINAATINSATTTEEWRATMDELDARRLKLLYVSPERFNVEGFKETLRRANPSFFAIDEAHCVSQWGHNFREDYLTLGQIADLFPDRPIAAFTATATEQVGLDVKTSLKLRDPFCVVASFDRPNLFYQIAYKDDFDRQLLDFLRDVDEGEPGIVYRSTRKKVEQTTEFLRKSGYKAEGYHAGMSDDQRIKTQENFANDTTQIVVATVAFGMGIDKSNVRFVVHGDLPADVESYYQETGRAGRDGAPARCALFYGYQDVAIRRKFLDDYEDLVAREAAAKRLDEMVRFAESDGCRRVNLLRYFGETYRPIDLNADDEGDAAPRPAATRCGACDFCVGSAERVDATIDAQKALSAMQRAGNRFGAGHIADILVGSETEKVVAMGHDKLPTFGVGADKTKRYWRYLIQALLTQGIAALAPDFDFPIPQVTSLGWEVMRGQRKVMILKRPDGKKKKPARAASILGAAIAPYDKSSLDPLDRKLFETLRELRAAIAAAERIPPYIVFTDKALVDMSRLKPTTPDDFLLVNGVGRAKLQNFGEEFMDAIREFLRDNPSA